MAETNPTSWERHTRTLDQFDIDPLAKAALASYSIPIPFNEVYDVESTRSARLSTLTGSAATMQFDMREDDWIGASFSPGQGPQVDNAIQQLIYRSIVGGYMPGMNKKLRPMRHPFFAGMYAKDIIGFAHRGPENNPNNKLCKYHTVRFMVNFEARNYPVAKNYAPDADRNPNWTEISFRSTTNRVTIGVGNFKLLGSAPTRFLDLATMNGLWIPQIQTYIVCTIYEVPESALRLNNYLGVPTVDTLWPSVIGGGLVLPWLGRVNANDFAGCPSQSLYFDSIEWSPNSPDPWGNMSGTVRLNLLINGFKKADGSEYGWNLGPDPTGELFHIYYSGVGPFVNTPPFGSQVFTTLFQLLNPKQ